MLIASVEGAAGCAGDQAGCSADVDDDRTRTEYNPRNVRVAREPLHGHGGDRRRELHIGSRRSRQPPERFE